VHKTWQQHHNRHNVNVLLSNSTFLFLLFLLSDAVSSLKTLFKLLSFLHLYLLFYYNFQTVLIVGVGMLAAFILSLV